MRILKIKHITAEGADKIHIVFERPCPRTPNFMDEFTFTCNERAAPEFYKALSNLATDVVTICELPPDYIERVSVSGVSVSYSGEKEVMGAVITAKMILNNSNQALNINTPFKTEDFHKEDGDPMSLLPHETVAHLKETLYEAEDYINGIREQTSLVNQLVPCEELPI